MMSEKDQETTRAARHFPWGGPRPPEDGAKRPSESIGVPTAASNTHPHPHPITRGKLTDFAADPLAMLLRLYDAHGPIAAFDDGGARVALAFHPEYVQRVLTDTTTFHAQFFPLRGPKRSSQRRLTGGLLSMNRDEHRTHRRMVMQPFQRRAFPDHVPAVESCTRELLAGWKQGDTIDLQAHMNEFMLRLVSIILFGHQDPEQAFRLGRMLHRWLDLNNQAGIGALVPMDGFSESYHALLAEAEVLEDALLEFIEQRADGPETERVDVLSILLDQVHAGHISREHLVGHTALIFGASHLTTAHSMTWMMFLLAQHPHVMDAVRAELRATDRTDAVKDDPTSLLSRTIRESMRILPASAYSVRATSQACHLGPLELSAGTTVIFCQLITHRMRELWERPRSYDPDRWLTISPSPYTYFPFGNGPRMCLGGPLAMVIIRTVLPAILRNFGLTNVPGSRVDAAVHSTMLAPTTPVLMRLGSPDEPAVGNPVGGDIHRLIDLPQ